MTSVHVIGESSGGKLHDVAHIRLYLPLQKLADEKFINLTSGLGYEGHKDSDIVIVHRTWSDQVDIAEAEQLVRFIRYSKKKLIYEIDDSLLDISAISSSSKGVIRTLAKNADAVIVSTFALKKRMERFNKNIKVITNYLDSRLFEERRGVFRENRPVTIGYMGTFTHQQDFQMIKLPLMRVLQKFQSKLRFELVGAIENAAVVQSLPYTEIRSLSGVTDYFSYWRWMNNNVFWDIGIAPLKYSEFTCCKSDIKYLDYSALGMAGIYSHHPAYENTVKHRETGLLVDNNCDAWQDALEELVRDTVLRNRIRMSAQDDLWGNRLLQTNTKAWSSLIREVADI